jgi:hypothetical protein
MLNNVMVMPTAGPAGRAVCGRLPGEIIGLNLAGGMDV